MKYTVSARVYVERQFYCRIYLSYKDIFVANIVILCVKEADKSIVPVAQTPCQPTAFFVEILYLDKGILGYIKQL